MRQSPAFNGVRDGKSVRKRTDSEVMQATSLAIEGMSYQAIAEVMGKTAAQVEGKLKVGLRRIGMNLNEARREKDIALQLLRQADA